MILETLRPHFVRWVKIAYGGKHDRIDHFVRMYEIGQCSFMELVHCINALYSDWRQDWEQYKNYNKL